MSVLQNIANYIFSIFPTRKLFGLKNFYCKNPILLMTPCILYKCKKDINWNKGERVQECVYIEIALRRKLNFINIFIFLFQFDSVGGDAARRVR